MLQEKRGMCFAIQPKELFPGKLSGSTSGRQRDTAATEAVTVQRVAHSGSFDLGLCSEDKPEQSKHKHARPEAQAAQACAIRSSLLLSMLQN